jgi:UDP-N-acetylmuramyl pentapeptide phosphotransferase/UDP-N-acetylglucosamine-1-phosphate transferase
LWVVSAVNVVNFMDGIDGLIGTQAMVFGAHLTLMASTNGVAEVMGLGLIGAAAGFLIWNWAPARIFMGDVGSGSLGFLFVLGGLLVMHEGRIGLIAAFLPLYPLFLDASVTLVLRAWRHERVAQAHRSHFYQRLANGPWNHAQVSILYAVAAAGGLAAAQATAPRVGPIVVGAYLVSVPAVAWSIGRRFLMRSNAL